MKTLNLYIIEKLKISKHNHNILNKISNCKSEEEFDNLYKDIFKEGEKLSSDTKTLDIIYSDNKDKILSTFDKNDLILAKYRNDNHSFFFFRPFKGKSQLCLLCNYKNYKNNKIEFEIWDIYNRDKYGGYYNPNLEGLEYYKCNNNLAIQFDDFVNELFDDNLYNIELCPNLEKKLNISSDKDKIIKRLL